MILDILVGLGLLVGLYKGAKEGFFVSLAAFLSLLVGVITALKFSNLLKDYFHESLQWESTFVPIISFILTFIVAVLIVKMIARMITHVLQAIYLGFINRILGAIFQVLVVVLLLCVILSFFDHLNEWTQLITQEELSKSYSYRFYSYISHNYFHGFFKLVNDLFQRGVVIIQPTLV